MHGVSGIVALSLLVVQGSVAAGLLHAPDRGFGVPGGVGLGADGRVEVDGEGEDVEGEDEGDGPLDGGAGVVVLGPGGCHEGDGEEELDDNEDELDPEGGAQDAVLAVF